MGKFEGIVTELERQVALSLVAQADACEAMRLATLEITRLREENDALRRKLGKARLLADLQADKVSMFHRPQAE